MSDILPPHVQAVPYAALSKELNIKKAKTSWGHTSFNKLWKFRIRLIQTLVLRGVSVLMNDLDAVWLKDPFRETFPKLPANTDIIAQRASFPWELGSRAKTPGKWGRLVGVWTVLALVKSLALSPRFR